MATKTGNITDESSIEYGSGVLGPLVCRLRTGVSSSSSCMLWYSSGSCGIGPNCGISVEKL